MERKILCTSYNGDLGGGELRLLEYLKLSSLPRQSFAVAVFEQGVFADQIKQLGIDVLHIPWSLATPRPRRQFQDWRAGHALQRFLREQQAEIIFCNTFNDFDLICRRTKDWKIPLVLRSRAEVFPYFERYSIERRRQIIEHLNSRAKRILTTTEYDRTMMIDAGVRAENVYTVRQGVDVCAYDEARPAGCELRKSFGFGQEHTVFGFFGRIVPQKGHEVFLEALHIVHNQRPQARALIVGDVVADGSDPDGYRKFIEQRIRELGLTDIVVRTGFRSDVPALMNAVDIMVHASLIEPFGTVIVEGMGTGRAVIASNTLGPREIIEDGMTGILLPPGDSAALASGMLRLVDNPAMTSSLGERAKSFVRENFSLKATIGKLDQHLAEVLGLPL
jgi:glycosyltransferase involved in cell wall biosynthesis